MIEDKLRGPWEARTWGAQQRIQRCESAIADHCEVHLAELADELKPQACEAQERLEAALESVHEAVQAWHGTSTACGHLLRSAKGRVDANDLAPLRIDPLVGEVDKLRGNVPSPTPRSLASEPTAPITKTAA